MDLTKLKEPTREWIRLDCIDIPPHRREYDEATVVSLVGSIKEIGLLHPISVRVYDDANGDQHIDIVAGRKRLEALTRLGIVDAECVIIVGDDALAAELIEIDENLCRGKLTDSQEAAAIARRKAIYEELHPETVHGAIGGGHPKQSRQVGDSGDAPLLRFSAATAKATGKSERTIQRAAKRGAAIGADNLNKIAGTSLDKGTELDALAAKPPAERQELIERAAAGEKVTAREEQAADSYVRKLMAVAVLGTDDVAKFKFQIKELRKELREKKRELSTAKSREKSAYAEWALSRKENAKLREDNSILKLEVASWRGIFNDPAKLEEQLSRLKVEQERIEHAKAAEQENDASIPLSLRRTAESEQQSTAA